MTKSKRRTKKGTDVDGKEISDIVEVGLMVPSVIHDIRGHLSVIKAQAQIALRGSPDRGTANRLKKILEQIDLIEELIEEFRSFYRMGEVTRRWIEVSKLVDEAFVGVSHKLKDDIKILKDIEDSRVHVNRIMMRQALINLLSNAIDALEGSREKTVGVLSRKIGEKTFIWVFDTGKGIPRRLLPRIFKRSFTTKTSGMGLGLIVAKKIVESHGAKIKYEKNVEKIRRMLNISKVSTVFEIQIPSAKDV